MTDPRLVDLHQRVGGYLEKIAALFTQRPKITIVIRTPWLGDKGDVVLTDDDFEAVFASIRRLEAAPDTKHLPAGASHA